MPLRERKTPPRKYDCTVHMDIETLERAKLYSKRYGMSISEALYEIVNRTIAIEENLGDGPKLRT